MVDLITGKQIIVTGGEGFIGNALVERLRHHNKVVSIDNGVNSQSRARKSNVVYHKAQASEIAEFIPSNGVDLVFHLGEYSRVEPSFDRIDFIIENNFNQFSEVCSVASKCDAKLIYSASSTLFSAKAPDFSPSPYQVFKKLNVSFLNEFASLKKLNYAITYFYNAYGPGEVSDGEFSTVVGKFLDRAKRNLPLEITLPGTQRRNFTHVEDIVDGLVLVGARGNGDGYGIGCDESYSISELASLISDNFYFGPEKKGNRSDALLNTDKLRQLGWCPKRSLKHYISEELKHC